jgi:hypothetical protein
LAAALAMSMGQDSNDVEMTEDEEMARALALSMQDVCSCLIIEPN